MGVGQHLDRQAPQLLAMARDVLELCPCEDGCPGCVGPPAVPGLGIKQASRAVLRRLSDGVDATTAVEAQRTQEATAVAAAG